MLILYLNISLRHIFRYYHKEIPYVFLCACLKCPYERMVCFVLLMSLGMMIPSILKCVAEKSARNSWLILTHIHTPHLSRSRITVRLLFLSPPEDICWITHSKFNLFIQAISILNHKCFQLIFILSSLWWNYLNAEKIYISVAGKLNKE